VKQLNSSCAFNEHDKTGTDFFGGVCDHVSKNADTLLPVIIRTTLEKEIGNDTSDEVRRTEEEDCKNFAEELFRHIENYKKVLAGKEKNCAVLRSSITDSLQPLSAFPKGL
jgi:hypothetical protein